MLKIVTDVKYGAYDRNVVDAYLVQSKQPTPALLYFHGGGYIHGDKSMVNQKTRLTETCFSLGISVLSANYRLITESPFPAPMNDGTRAIQFVRHMADEWNLHPGKIVLAGSSAGAHISLWNAFKGNLANPGSVDPVERCSSSVSAAVVFDSQISKDQAFYHEHYSGDQLQPNILKFYGVGTKEELERQDIRELSYEASAINFLTEASPPVLTSYSREFTSLPIAADLPIGHVIHHPVHGYVLKQRMGALGLVCVFRHPGALLQDEELSEFLQTSLEL